MLKWFGVLGYEAQAGERHPDSKALGWRAPVLGADAATDLHVSGTLGTRVQSTLWLQSFCTVSRRRGIQHKGFVISIQDIEILDPGSCANHQRTNFVRHEMSNAAFRCKQ